jgi:hypothetical protein
LQALSVPVSSADVTQAGNVGIQIQNPDATTCNTVQLVLVRRTAVKMSSP